MGKASLFGVPVLGHVVPLARRLPRRARRHRPQGRCATRVDDARGRRACSACIPRAHASTARRSSRSSRAPRTSRSVPACRSCRSGSPGTEEIMRAKKDPVPRFGRVTIVVGEPIVPEPRARGVVPREQGRRAHRDARRRAAGAVRRGATSCATAPRAASRASRRGWRASRRRRRRGRRRTVRPAPWRLRDRRRTRARRASRARARARAARGGGGKYSSSSVTRTCSTPRSGASTRDHRVDQLLGGAGARGHADDLRHRRAGRGRARRGRRRAARRSQPASRATFASASVFDELALPITTTASARCAIAVSARLAVRGREAEVVARRGPHVAGACPGLVEEAGPLAVRERRLREHRDLGAVAEVGEHVGRGRRRARRGGSRRARPPACRPLRRARRGRRRGR